MEKKLLVLALVLSLIWSIWNRLSSPGNEPKDPEQLVGDPLSEVLAKMQDDLPGIAMGFCVLDEEGKVLSELNAATPMIPASTFKTLTTVAALDQLGQDFRFETRLRSVDAVKGVIPGDLVIQGGGDPMLSMEDLESWADRLKGEGVIRIEGSVVGDGSLFPSTMAGDFWSWGDVGNGYGSPVSGLNLEHNRYVAVFSPGKKLGLPAEFAGSRPVVPGVEWLNEVTTGEADSGDGVVIYGGPLAKRIHLTGSVPLGGKFGVRGAVPDPCLFAAFHLDRLLKERGIKVVDAARAVGSNEVIKGGKVWLRHESPTLAEILPGLHARSDNHETESLFQMLGVKKERPAAAVLETYWRERGVERIRIVDGSGLSRADFISAEDLARVQWTASQARSAGIYRNSLSPGYDGKVRWKGGAMSSVRSWTGYFENEQGELLSFSLIFNHYQDGSRLGFWRDELVKGLKSLGEVTDEGD